MKRVRKDFCAQVREASTTLAEHLRFIDEFGVHWGMTRLFGRAAPGERVAEATSGYSGAHYTVVATLGLQGITAPGLFEGAMNRRVFETYVEQVLAPTLHPGDLVVLDNLSTHKGEPKARTFDTLVEALCEVLRAINPSDVIAWFAHCGYAVNP